MRRLGFTLIALVLVAASGGAAAEEQRSGPPIEPAARQKDSAIARAAEQGDSETVRALIKQRVDVNAPGADGTPALHWIVRMQDVSLARALIRAGAEADRANRYGV